MVKESDMHRRVCFIFIAWRLRFNLAINILCSKNKEDADKVLEHEKKDVLTETFADGKPKNPVTVKEPLEGVLPLLTHL